jgi:LDH2 family malate/lactate/ureidoglycolate dehydrogenase
MPDKPRQLSLAEAGALARKVCRALGHDAADAKIIADHIVDAAARGEPFGGLSRLLVLAEHRRRHGPPRGEPRLVRRTSLGAAFDGRGHFGYVAAHHAVRDMIARAGRRGIALTSVSNIYYAGNLASYMEMATRRGLIGLAAANTRAAVAPYGGREALLGTNPVAFGFPTGHDPVILDIATSATSLGEVIIAETLGTLLPDGVALDKDGRPTRDPKAARSGSYLAWGGHRGAGLGLVAQLFGILAGSAPVIGDDGWGFFALAFKPELLMPKTVFRKRAAALARHIHAAPASDPASPPRLPFAGSIRAREQARRRGIAVDETVYQALLDACAAPVLRR